MPGKANKSNTGKIGDASTLKAAREVLAGKSKKSAFARLMPFIGPAFIASVASKVSKLSQKPILFVPVH